jgi:hypothetical protein
MKSDPGGILFRICTTGLKMIFFFVDQMKLKHYQVGKKGVRSAFAPRLVSRVADALLARIEKKANEPIRSAVKSLRRADALSQRRAPQTTLFLSFKSQ